MKLRFEDEEIWVGVTSEEFQTRIRELLSESEARDLDPICNRIVFWKGDLPPPAKLNIERLWFFGYSLAIIVFFYGVYSMGLKVFELLP